MKRPRRSGFEAALLSKDCAHDMGRYIIFVYETAKGVIRIGSEERRDGAIVFLSGDASEICHFPFINKLD